MHHISLPLPLLVLLMTACLAAVEPAVLTIGTRELHPLSPLVFGQFLERPSWGGEQGPEGVCDAAGRLPAEVERHLAAMHAPVVRFPVGTDGDYIDWTDLADLPGRVARPQTTGHKGGVIGNRFGFPEYFELADRLGWQTILVVNLRDALYRVKPLAEAAEHAAKLVAYARGRRIAAVQVGNEGWFFWPPKAEQRAALGVATADDSAAWLRTVLLAYADAIRRVDATVPLICDAPRPADGDGGEAAPIWRDAVDHDDVRSRYAMLAAHAYAPMGLWHCERDGNKLVPAQLDGETVWSAAVATPGRFAADGRALADATAYDDIARLGFAVAVTEWNWNGWDWRKRFPQVEFADGLPAALGAAGFLHGLMRHPHVRLATQSMLLGTAWGITGVRVAKDGGVGFLPQAEAVRLHAEFHGDQVIEAALAEPLTLTPPPRLTTWWPEAPAVAVIDAVVTRGPLAWYVHVLNRSRTEARSLDIVLPEDAPLAGTAHLNLLTGSSQASTSAAGGMRRSLHTQIWSQRRLRLELPPAALAVVVLPR